MDEEQGYRLKLFNMEVGSSSTSKASAIDLDPQLIGKIISDSVLDSEEVESFIRKAWEWHYGKVHITPLEDNNNIYLFSFQEAASAEKVIQDGPWVVMGNFLCLQQWGRTRKRLEDVHFTYVPVWDQVHGLMLNQMTERNAESIGNCIGNFVKVDQRSLDLSLNWGFLRINVLLDCSAAIKTDMWVSRQGQAKYQINFKYEKMGDFCFNCGRLGHILSECKEEALPLWHPQFGTWLRASTEVANFEEEHVVDLTETEDKDSWNETNKPLLGKEMSEDKERKPRRFNKLPRHPCDIISVVWRLAIIVLALKFVWFLTYLPGPPIARPPISKGS